MNEYILGVSCGYHDSAAALIKGGKVLGACEEERFTGIKHDSSFPSNVIKWLFTQFNIDKNDLMAICFYDNPNEKMDRIEKTTNRGGLLNYFNRRSIIKNNAKFYKQLHFKLESLCGKNTKIVYGDHHLSHMAYAYYTSPYKKSAILSVDGVGEWDTTVIGYGENNRVGKIDSIVFPNSLGLLYSTITSFLGFKPNSGEYKVMGLASYGDYKTYLKPFSKLYNFKLNSKFEINMKYFDYDWSDSSMFNENLSNLFGFPNRLPEEPIEQKHKDLAATLQHEYESIFNMLVNNLYGRRSTSNLCITGGCAYNGTANGKVLNRSNYNSVWIPPAPSDAGSAIGCALKFYYDEYPTDIERIDNTNPFLGPAYGNDEIKKSIDKYSDFVFGIYKSRSELVDLISNQIKNNMVVALYQGKMEFGARALGNRSILANPCDPSMKDRINTIIKKREGFRPFAPMVMESQLSKYFEYTTSVPYMNQVVKVKEQYVNYLPSVTHVDGTARVQTVNKTQNQFVYKILEKLNVINKYPIMLNTSFNVKDKTMVLTPDDAIQTFLETDIDTLVMSNYIIKKKIL